MSETTLDVPDWIWQRIEYCLAVLGETINDPERPQLPLKADDFEMCTTQTRSNECWTSVPLRVPDGTGWWLVSSHGTSQPGSYEGSFDGSVLSYIVALWARRIDKTTEKENPQ